MNIILLEKIKKLGDIGDEVKVKSGYARNFLVPNKKALYATSENKKYFEEKKTEIKSQNDKLIKDATDGRCYCVSAECMEHGANSAIYTPLPEPATE